MATNLTGNSALRYSFDALSAIEEIERCPEFTSFYLKKLQDRADEMADQVLHDPDISDKQREEIRQQRLGVLAALQMLPSEKAAHENILHDHGLTRGDDLPGDVQ